MAHGSRVCLEGRLFLRVQNFYQRFSEREFKVGESDSGKTLRLKLKHFMEYMATQKDDSPLYLFESSFQKKDRAPEIASYYSVPKFFQEDLMQIVSRS